MVILNLDELIFYLTNLHEIVNLAEKNIVRFFEKNPANSKSRKWYGEDIPHLTLFI